ncbi:MAG TPA: TonB-dependent receptor [Spirochaetota bacterium]|nr:TonB-dependent receptor [Spirochaetota bacterium]HPS85842.1 TonB-dependent receptor [Spirochaetota bacterium]
MNYKILTPVLVMFYVMGFSETVYKNDPVIITASRYDSSISKEGKSITVVTEKEIKDSGNKVLGDVLESIPGVIINRSGTDGGLTTVNIRGSKSGNVLVLIDGVKISDPMGVGSKLFDISNIRTDNIERIEVVRGAMSSMYGAEASGGVINIITKKGIKRSVVLTGEAGSNKSFGESVSVSDSTENSSFNFFGSHYRSEGISKAKDQTGNNDFDNDGYENVTMSGKMSSKISDNIAVDYTLNYIDSNFGVDDGASEDDINHINSSKVFTSRGDLKFSPFTWWNIKGGLSYMSYVKEDVDPIDPTDAFDGNTFTYDGSNTGFDFINKFNIGDFNTLIAGYEHFKETGSSNSNWGIFEKKSLDTDSVFIHDSVSVWNRLFLNLGARLVDNELFGENTAWDTSVSYILPVIETRLKASAGTAFRSPSLYELYDSFSGNKDLKPETSFVYDVGVYQEFFDGVFSIDCSYFVQSYEDMITTDIAWKYINLDGVVENKGVEFISVLRLNNFLKASYGYTYLKYTKNESGQEILKRPANKHSASLTVTPISGLDVTGTYLYVDTRKDYLTASSSVTLKSYSEADLVIRYKFNETLSFNAKCENITDSKYEESYGYNTKGRSYYGGVEISL